jgi:hypothetical protein
MRGFSTLTWCILFGSLTAIAAAQEIIPYPRDVIRTEKLIDWRFTTSADVAGWTAAHDCTLALAGGVLRIQSSGNDPYLFAPRVRVSGPIAVRLRMKCAAGGNGQVFWATTTAPNFNEDRSRRFPLIHDNQWHDYSVPLAADGVIEQLRLDPAEGPGEIEVESFQLVRETLHPLEIQFVHTDGAHVSVRLKNYSTQPISFTMDGRPLSIGATVIGEFSEIVPGSEGAGAFGRHEIVIQPSVMLSYDGMLSDPVESLPPIHRSVSIVNAAADANWTILRSRDLVMRAAPDGSGARIELGDDLVQGSTESHPTGGDSGGSSGGRLEHGGRLVGVLAPLIIRDGSASKLKLTAKGNTLAWRGKGITLTLSLHEDEITASIQSDRPCEGPVLRAFGPLEQGIFPGLEYLARGEHSSSTLDIETEEHVRFAPDRLKVTMPLMAFVTDRATEAMTWRDMSLQPVFATPNFLDGPEGHRASLRGTNIECTILVRRPGPIEDVILWAAQRRGLPPLPAEPRSRQAEVDLCLAALSGPPLKTADGWGHCAEASWPRQPYADQASTVWRLTGQIPSLAPLGPGSRLDENRHNSRVDRFRGAVSPHREEIPSLPRLVPGGAHIVNDAIYFVTGRARDWLDIRSAEARGIMAEQKPDGSFRYEGEFRRGHFEDTASGYCAMRAVELLEHARLTGDAGSLEAGVKALEFMKHLRDPRGAQTWECPLHTPDILASAFLVQAYVRGYELTGKTDYLEHARAWAITGLPFVYQWSEKPTMAYATIAVFGATGWRAPNWMGLPVQWCGYKYAYALTMLAPFDHAMDWNRIATGILTTAEEMQYPSGPFAGCEPDSFNLGSQQRNGPAINPCAIVSLRLALEGKLDSLAVASGSGHRVVAPFPVSIRDGQAHVEAREGVAYEVVVDGERIVEVKSRGKGMIPLAGTK